MFIVNGEPLHETTHPTEFKWMNKKIAELRAQKKKEYSFSAFNKRTKVLREDGRWIPQKNKKRIVTMIGSTEEATGVHQTWAYASGMGALKDDGSNRYKLKRLTRAMDHDTRFSIEKDYELIFFFEYLSNNRHIKKIDHELNNRLDAEKIALRSKAESLIYSTDSPIHPENVNSDKALKNIALSWGIGNALSMDVYLLMRELWNKVQSSQAQINHTGRGFKQFIEDVSKYGNSDKRATVTLAIKEGVLHYDSRLWKLISDGEEQFLCGVPTQDEAHKEQYIMDYVLNHDRVYLAVESLLEKPIREINKKDTVVERGLMLKKAKEELGWSGEHYRTVSKMKMPELEKLIADGRRPEVAKKE